MDVSPCPSITEWGAVLIEQMAKEFQGVGLWLTARVTPLRGDRFLQLVLVDTATNNNRAIAVAQRLARAADYLLFENVERDALQMCSGWPLNDDEGALFGRFSFLSKADCLDLGPGCVTFTVSLNGTSYFVGRDMAGEIALMLHEASGLVCSGVRHHEYFDDSGVPIAVFHWDENALTSVVGGV